MMMIIPMVTSISILLETFFVRSEEETRMESFVFDFSSFVEASKEKLR